MRQQVARTATATAARTTARRHASSSSSRFKDFVKEWREMESATQPMADPEGTPVPIRLRDYLRMSLRDHLRVVRESVHLYRLSLMDRDEAIREVKIDNELMRQVREAQAKAADSSAEQSPAGAPTPAATDMEELAAKVRGMFPKDVQRVASVQEAVQVAVDRKEDVRALATDRLETVGAALAEFMQGYREGKEAGLRDVEEGKDGMLESLMEPLKVTPSHAAAGAGSAPAAAAAEPSSTDSAKAVSLEATALSKKAPGS